MPYLKNYTRREPEWLIPWLDMAEGRLTIHAAIRDVIREVVGDEVDGMLAAQGYARHDTDDHDADATLHERYKEVEEKLRNMPHMEAVRQIDRYFRDLTPEARAVLVQQLSIPSIARRAEATRISPDKYREMKHELPNFLK